MGSGASTLTPPSSPELDEDSYYNSKTGSTTHLKESEDVLLKFATKAYNSILKPLKEKPKDVPIALFDLELSDGNVSGKRTRILTEKIKESEEQQETFSPKKKKKSENEKNKSTKVGKVSTTESNSKAEKKKVEEAAILKESVMMTSMMQQQFVDLEKTDEKDLEKTDEKEEDNVVTKDDSIETSLLETWNLCRSVNNSENDHLLNSQQSSKIPAPTKDVLQLFRCLCNPDVQSYFKKIVEHFDGSVCSHSRIEDCFEPQELHNEPYVYSTNSGHQPHTGYVHDEQQHGQHMPGLYGYGPGTAGTTGNMYGNDPQNAYLADVNIVPESSVFNDVHVTPRRSPRKRGYYPYVPLEPDFRESPSDCELPVIKRPSPRRKGCVTTVLPESENMTGRLNLEPAELQPSTSQVDQSTPLATKKPVSVLTPLASTKSPEPAVVTPLTSTTGKGLLLKKYPDVMADQDLLDAAISAAKKSVKPGYTLCYKLLLAVFTAEELAGSRGQGLLKTKKKDDRPVLDKEKCSAVKDYTTRWCKKNERPLPSEAEMNNAVTEQCSACRKKLKDAISKNIPNPSEKQAK